MIPLDAIIPDERFQPRTDLNETHVRQLMASDPDTWPPLLVTFSDDGDKLLLIDGFHRHEAAMRLSLRELPSRIEPEAGYPEAFAANMHHGLTLTTSERKDFAIWLHEDDPTLSYRELGRRTGLNHETIKRAIEQPATSTDGDRPQAKSDPIRKLVREVVRTYEAGHGRSLFGLGKAGNPTAFQREIASYGSEDQPEVAQALLAFGHACVTAAQPFLLGEGNQS